MMMRVALLSLLGTMAVMPDTTTAFVNPLTRATPTTRLQVVSDPPPAVKQPEPPTSKREEPLSPSTPPFKRIMAANRAEIAVRIMRAATELNAGTVAIYVHEDRYSQHRQLFHLAGLDKHLGI